FRFDAALNGPGAGVGFADQLNVEGNLTGTTQVEVNDLLAGTAGTFNPDGIVFATYGGVTSDNAFVTDPIDKGLFSYDVFNVAGDKTWVLASTPDRTFFELPSIVSGLQKTWHDANGVWLNRTADLRSASQTVCNGSLKDTICQSTGVTPGGWVQVFGATAQRDQDRVQSFALLNRNFQYDIGYDQKTGGVVGGIDGGDVRNGTGYMFGLMGGYVGGSQDFDNSTTNVDIQSGVFGAYMTFLSNGWFIDGKFAAQFGNLDYSNRGATVASSSDAHFSQYGITVDGGYRFNFGQTFIEPGATLSWVSTDLDNLNVYSTNVRFGDGDSLRGRLGLRIGTQVAYGAGARMEPFLGASIWQEFDGSNSASITSNGFTFTSRDSTEGTYGEISGGLNFFDGNWNGFIKGDAQFGENDYQSYSGQAGIRMKF
ncbi:MAG: autotransporter outer membrane beta-barrel domain-containing protein, partial [Planctomycetes bacterium]|nr:autotransporter outer membrane beta-barrel domain-containing protein [Planctomycetota bacterium]